MTELTGPRAAARTLSRWRGALLGTTMMTGGALAVAAMLPAAAHAADWLGVTGDFNLGSNWAGGSVPATATFVNILAVQNVTATADHSLSLLEYSNDAPAYTLSTSPGIGISIADITNSSLVEQNLSAGANGGFVISGQVTGAMALIGGANNGAIQFNAGASAAGSRFIGQGGFLNLSGFTGQTLSLGSIEGSGIIRSDGPATLSVGGLNSSTTYSGTIQDAVGITKTGTGTLTLTGANSYSGLTRIDNGTLRLGDGTTDGSIVSLVEMSSSGTLQFNNAATQTANNSVNGLGTIVKAGPGRLILTGGTSTGTVTRIDAGILQYSSSSSFSSSITVNAGGTFEYSSNSGSLRTYSGVIQGAGSFIKSGTDRLTLSALNSYTGQTTIQQGTLRAGAANVIAASSGLSLDSSGAAVFDLNGHNQSIGSLSGGGSIAMGAALLTVNQAVDATYSGTISGTGTLTKAGIGVLTLTGRRSDSGLLVVSQGTLRLGDDDRLVSTATAGILGGATLDLDGHQQRFAGLTGSGTVLLGSGGRLSVGEENVGSSFSGTVTGNGSVTKVGTGILTLSGSNTHTGGTRIEGGQIRLGAADRLDASGEVAIGTGAVFDLGGFDQSVGRLVGIGAGAGSVTLGSGTLTLGNGNASAAFGGAISGTGGLIKTGSGTATLSGTSSYGGATQVAGGTLLVDGALAATSGVTVASGATLGGSGSIGGAVTIQSGGTLSAGNSPGTLTVSSLTLNSGSNTVFELNSPGVVGGPTNDLVIVDGIGAAGNLVLGGTLSATVASAGYYRLFDVTGGGAISGGFDTVTVSAPSVAGAAGIVYIAPSAAPNQVNLAVTGSAQTLQFWDGADTGGNGSADGGSGTWNATNTNWAASPGTSDPNAPWLGSVGVFQGSAGTVTVSGSQSFDTLQFNTDGYLLTGDALALGVAAGGTINTAAGVTTTIASVLVDGGGTSLTKVGTGTLILTGLNTYSGGTTVAGGTLQAGSENALGAGTLTLAGGTFRAGTGFTNTFANAVAVDTAGGVIDINGQVVTLTGDIADGNGSGGTLSLVNSSAAIGRIDLGGSNTYSGPTSIGAGVTLAALSNGAFSANSDVALASTAGMMANGHDVTVRSLSGGGVVVNGHDTQAGSLTLALPAGTARFDGSIADDLPGETGASLSLVKTGAGTQILAGTNTYTGGTTVLDGTLQIGDGGTAGSITGDIANSGTVTFNRSDAASFGGVVSGTGTLRQSGSGITTLTGASTYTGATFVDAGSLVVNGSITSSSGVTVAAGGSIGGSGSVPSLTVNGLLSPGNSPGTLTVDGNLTLGPAATYVAEIQGASADRVDVGGTASLAGTLRLMPLGGAYLFGTPYTLLSAAGGRSGTFGAVDTAGSFGDGVTTSVGYGASEVQLTLTPKPLAPIVDPVVPPAPGAPPSLGVGRPLNAYAVASAIDRSVAGGADPSALFAIYNLPAAAIPGAVNQLSGEVHAGAAPLAVQAAGGFMGTMLDQGAAGRLGGSAGAPRGPAGFTADMPGAVDRSGPSSFDPARFAIWGSGFGSTGRIDADASVGTARRTLNDAHLAIGADLLLAPAIVAGVAVSGGTARASLPAGLGRIESGVFQAGLYGTTRIGALKLSAAASYGRFDNDVSRAIPALGLSRVTSTYVTQAWSGRFEATARVFGWGGFALSPLAAIQATSARSPAALETTGSGVAVGSLNLARRTDLTSRGELGLQIDAKTQLGAAPVNAYLRAAWAHYFERDARFTASLNGLPGASFIASGARPDRNSALLAVGADADLGRGIRLGARLDAELSENERRVGGSARLSVEF